MLLVLSIQSNTALGLAIESLQSESGETPSLLMVFLIEFGIIIPVLAVAAGIIIIIIGIKLFLGNIATARWAQVILFWLSLGAVAVSGFLFIQQLTDTNTSEAQTLFFINQNPLIFPIILLVLGGFFGACLYWLKRNAKQIFHGTEMLNDAEIRFAWNLLIPALAVLIFVAGRPLEQTFIRSLTDKRFAGHEIPNYVGLDNYRNLLGIRFDRVDCRITEETGECALNPNGTILWNTIDRDILREGYRTVWTFRLPFTEEPTGLTISGTDRDFIESVWTTLIFTIISVSLELGVGLFIAMTVNSKFSGRGFMRAVMLVPWAIPTAITARLWENMLRPTSSGIINHILMDLNIISEPQAWLAISALQLPSAIMVDVWKTAPFVALLLLAGLQIIPEDLYEAASVDGANGFQKLVSVTLPLLRPTIAVALVFRTLDALKVFDLFNVLFARKQLTMATYNYEMLVGSQRDGYASAISIAIFIFISVFAIFYVRMLNVETD